MSRSSRKSMRPDPTVAPVIRNPLKGNRLELRSRFTPSAYQENVRIYASAARAVNHFGTSFHGVGAAQLRKIPITGNPAGAHATKLYGAVSAAAKAEEVGR